MVEEGQHQQRIPIRFEDEDEDLISKLPDCVLTEILSRLPDTKYAIRTGSLSKRWIHVWHTVPNLIFLHPHGKQSPDFISLVNETLTQHTQSKLNKFELHCFNDHILESHIHNWIRYAVNCNVQGLNLTLHGPDSRTGFPLDQLVFICSSFTNLALSRCLINPIGAISWKNLRSLYISFLKLNEDLIENILIGSPVLENLELNTCDGFKRLNITSKSVKNLVLSGWIPFYTLSAAGSNIMEINAPNILSLTIKSELWLSRLLLRNVSSLAVAELDYKMLPRDYGATLEKVEEEMLEGFILNLFHVKKLKIGASCHKVLNRLKAKGFISPSNLKVVGATP